MLNLQRDGAGFRRHTSGLIVPEEVGRKRQVFTKDEYRAVDKAIQLLAERRVRLLLKCDMPDCTDRTLVRVPQPDGGYILRCGCRDRIFQKTF